MRGGTGAVQEREGGRSAALGSGAQTKEGGNRSTLLKRKEGGTGKALVDERLNQATTVGSAGSARAPLRDGEVVVKAQQQGGQVVRVVRVHTQPFQLCGIVRDAVCAQRLLDV